MPTYLGNLTTITKTIAPPGTNILAHAKPTNRSSWAPHGDKGWYVGPSMHHYICVNCYFPKTRSQRDVDTVTFFPKLIHFPEVKTDDFLKQAALDIIFAILISYFITFY